MPKLPKFEEWKAPWETAGTEFDADKAKKRIYDLLLDKETSHEKHEAQVAELTTKNAGLETEVTEFKKAGETAAEKSAREAAESAQKAQEKALADAQKASDLRIARLEVAVEKGLTTEDMNRIIGSTKEELQADADEFLKTYRGEEQQEEQTSEGRQRPQRLRNPLLGDPGANNGVSTTQLLEQVPRL